MSNIFNETVRPKALELLKRAELPTDPAKADYRKNIFLNNLAAFNYQNDNGQITALDSSGFEIRDRHGYNLTIDQFLKTEFDKYFETSDMPISEAECIARLKDEKITPAERKRLTEQWEKLKR